MSSSYILSDNGVSSGSAGLKSSAGNDGVLVLQTANSSGTATNAIYINNTQNIGIGVNPETWYSPVTAIRIGSAGTVSATNNGTANSQYRCNEYIDSSGTVRYIVSGAATRYQQLGASHAFYSAPSGTAGDAITFTTVATVSKDNTFALQGGTSVAGTGITFPATQSASSDANTLDDYEEGGWTPTINFNGSSTGVTYSAAEGTYTKIGRMVTVNGVISLSNHGSATGNAFIGGLPFTVGNLLTPTGLEASGLFGYFANLGSSVACLMLDALEGTTTVGIYYVPAAGANNVTAATQTLIANTFDCRFSITYFT